jgi:hypothetical protein
MRAVWSWFVTIGPPLSQGGTRQNDGSSSPLAGAVRCLAATVREVFPRLGNGLFREGSAPAMELFWQSRI